MGAGKGEDLNALAQRGQLPADLRDLGGEVLDLPAGPAAGAPGPDEPPAELNVARPEADLIDAAAAALPRAREVYVHAGVLARLVDGTPGSPARAVPLNVAAASDVLSRAARWVRLTEARGETRATVTRVPACVAAGLLARGSWPAARRLSGIVDAPTLRPDGTVLERPGWDPASGLLYAPAAGVAWPAVPAQPSRGEAATALAVLADVVCDVLFRSPDDRAAWLALLLTVIARHALEAPAPLALVSATTPGEGKSLLAELVGLVALGRLPALVTQEKDAAEERKALLTFALEGEALVVIDNVEDRLGSAALATALTSGWVRGRLLGQNVTAAARAPILVATGNNLDLRGDMARRSYLCELATGLEHPEERTGFRHDPIRPWALAERPRLLTAALTILRWHAAAGRPQPPGPPLGSFEAWSRVVRAPLALLGADPLGNRARIRSGADPEREAAAAFLAAWHQHYGDLPVSMRAVVADAGADGDGGLREAACALSPRLGRELTALALGHALRRWRGRVVGGFRLDRLDARSGPTASRLWRVTGGEA